MFLSDLFKSNGEKPKEDRAASPRPDYPSSYGTKTQSGERVTVENSLSLATAYRAKNIISDDVAKMPFQMIRRVGRNIEQVDPDPKLYNMAYLLQVSPNQWGWTPSLFKKATIEWLLFWGNAYIWRPAVRPPQLLILPAAKTIPVFDTEGNLWYKHTFTNGKPEYIPAVEILHLLINPDQTGFMGRGVITFARETFGEQLAAHKTRSNFYQQGLNPAAYIQVNATLSKEDRQRYREAYGEAIGGSDNAYKLAVFDNKITKFEAVTMQPKDAQFLESIEANDTDIANFFGMPLHMLNRGKEAYNSNEQKYIEYLQGTLDSYLVPWEEAARIKWITQEEQANTYFKFNRSALLRMATKDRAEVNEIRIRSGVMTPNEAREKDDVNPYDEGDQFYMTSNYAPIRPPDEQPEEGTNDDEVIEQKLRVFRDEMVTTWSETEARRNQERQTEQNSFMTRVLSIFDKRPEPTPVNVNIENHPPEPPDMSKVNISANIQAEIPPTQVTFAPTIQPAEAPVENTIIVHPADTVNEINVPPTVVEVKNEIKNETKAPKIKRTKSSVKRDKKGDITGQDTDYEYEE